MTDLDQIKSAGALAWERLTAGVRADVDVNGRPAPFMAQRIDDDEADSRPGFFGIVADSGCLTLIVSRVSTEKPAEREYIRMDLDTKSVGMLATFLVEGAGAERVLGRSSE